MSRNLKVAARAKEIGDSPAFPQSSEYGAEGLTKREWLLGMALQGTIASGDYPAQHIDMLGKSNLVYVQLCLLALADEDVPQDPSDTTIGG